MGISIHNGQYDRISADVNPVKRGDVFHVDYPPELKRLPLHQAAVAMFLLSLAAWGLAYSLYIGLRDIVNFAISLAQWLLQ